MANGIAILLGCLGGFTGLVMLLCFCQMGSYWRQFQAKLGERPTRLARPYENRRPVRAYPRNCYQEDDNNMQGVEMDDREPRGRTGRPSRYDEEMPRVPPPAYDMSRTPSRRHERDEYDDVRGAKPRIYEYHGPGMGGGWVPSEDGHY